MVYVICSFLLFSLLQPTLECDLLVYIHSDNFKIYELENQKHDYFYIVMNETVSKNWSEVLFFFQWH